MEFTQFVFIYSVWGRSEQKGAFMMSVFVQTSLYVLGQYRFYKSDNCKTSLVRQVHLCQIFGQIFSFTELIKL